VELRIYGSSLTGIYNGGEFDEVILTATDGSHSGAGQVEVIVSQGRGWFDTFFVRKYVVPEPGNGAWGAEEGIPAYFIITGSSSMTAGESNELTITAYDANGNVAVSYTGSQDLTFSGPSDALDGTIPTVEGTDVGTSTAVNFTNGVSDPGAATLIAYMAETTEVDVTDGTIDSFGDSSYNLDITVDPGVAVYLMVTGSSSMTVGESNELTITAYDAYGNVATSYSGSQDLTFSGPSSALDGTMPTVEGTDVGISTAVNFTNGVSDPGAVTLISFMAEATEVDVTDGTIDSFGDPSYILDITVDPGVAVSINFDQQPTDTGAGLPITPAVTVELKDQWDNLCTTDNTTGVEVAINNNPGGGTLSGTTIQTASSGVASFGDLSIDMGGYGYTLDATSAGLMTVTSDPFGITFSGGGNCFIATAAR
jgi:hypothetical protein